MSHLPPRPPKGPIAPHPGPPCSTYLGFQGVKQLHLRVSRYTLTLSFGKEELLRNPRTQSLLAWCKMRHWASSPGMFVIFPPAILVPEMAAPILWAPGILWLFLLENPHAHQIPRFKGGGVSWDFLRGGGAEVPTLFLWARGFF